MAIPYQERYRRGAHSGLHSNVRRALGMMAQQEALTGRPMDPSERASILQALYGNYADVYAGGYERAGAREQEQTRYDESYELQKEQLKQQQEAAEMQGYAQMAQLGLAGGQVYMQSGSTGGGGAAGGAGAGGSTSGRTSTHQFGSYEGGGEGTGGGGSWWTTSGRYGNSPYAKGFGFAAGGAAGYQASPYGQQAEEGSGGPTRSLYKPDPIGTHSRRRGERVGMLATGATAGTLAGGFPYGTAGGFVGAYFQENPETGKRGYQETWEYEIKPAWRKVFKPPKELADRPVNWMIDKEPTGVAEKVKDWFGF